MAKGPAPPTTTLVKGGLAPEKWFSKTIPRPAENVLALNVLPVMEMLELVAVSVVLDVCCFVLTKICENTWAVSEGVKILFRTKTFRERVERMAEYSWPVNVLSSISITEPPRVLFLISIMERETFPGIGVMRLPEILCVRFDIGMFNSTPAEMARIRLLITRTVPSAEPH